jgi:hypothetical protein
MAYQQIQGWRMMDQAVHATVIANRATKNDPQAVSTARPTSRHLITWIMPALLAIHACLLAYGAIVHSPTYNEPAHLMAGIRYWQFGQFDIYSVNPPFVRMVAAIPVLLAGCETDWQSYGDEPGLRPEMWMGSDFCKANGNRTIWLITIARWACIPFSLLGGYICFRWGCDLYGPTAGLLSLTLWCFCPNIIAHGQLITTDVAATALGLTACYMFWLWLKAPTWWSTVTSGLVLGMAELTKTTLVIFYLRELGMLCTRIVIGLYIINMGYGFEGSLTRLGKFRFVSQSLTGLSDAETALIGGNRFADSWLANIPVPLPKNYLIGIDLQRKDFETNDSEFFLGGVWSKTGWWYYYLYALAIKVPLGTWLLITIALGLRLLTGPVARFRDEFFLLAPAIVILTFVSSQTGMNEHLRYVLPIFPFVFIWLGSLTTVVLRSAAPSATRAGARYLIAISVVWSICSSVACYPHSLSYFNETIGPLKNGWKHLTKSNIDWGQDLLYLKKWLDDHPNAKPMRMAVYGVIASQLVDIDRKPFRTHTGEFKMEPGWYAISATTRSGSRQRDHSRKLNLEIQQIGAYETIGGSIIVFVKD